MHIQKFKHSKLSWLVHVRINQSLIQLNMGYNSIYVTHVTGASYDNGEIVNCK